jgi:imidazolonepropionase-like amidohydrolase
MIFLTGVRVIDGMGNNPVENQSILIDDSIIKWIGKEQDRNNPGESIEKINLQGKTLLPGLIDCHVHILYNPDPAAYLSPVPFQAQRDLLNSTHYARKTLEAGFTTIRDMMAPNEMIFALRDSIAAGEIEGPRILAAGKCITITGGHGTQFGAGGFIEADGEQEVLKAVRSQIKAGADLIKIMATRPALSKPFYGREAYQVHEMRAGVDEAHRAGVKVAAHCHSIVSGVKNAIRAGVDSIEHSAPLDNEAMDLMLEHGTYMVPTLSVSAGLQECIDQQLFPYPSGALKRALELAQETTQAVSEAYKRGVKIALGTDASMPNVFHGNNAREFELMVACGLSPMQALVAGTMNAAQNLGKENEIGTISVGKLADLVVVDGDPLKDIRILQDKNRIVMVIKEGQIKVDRRK